MNPSPQAIAAIRTRIADWSPSDAALAAVLNAPAVANSVTAAPQVPRPFAVSDVLGALAPASLAAVASVPYLGEIRDDINAGSRSAVLLWGSVLLAAGKISQVEHDTIVALLMGTVPDPSYQPQIGWAQANLGRPVDSLDIQASRPGA